MAIFNSKLSVITRGYLGKLYNCDLTVTEPIRIMFFFMLRIPRIEVFSRTWSNPAVETPKKVNFWDSTEYLHNQHTNMVHIYIYTHNILRLSEMLIAEWKMVIHQQNCWKYIRTRWQDCSFHRENDDSSVDGMVFSHHFPADPLGQNSVPFRP